jgi:hypothetical protein
MLKFLSTNRARALVGLGLTDENLRRMQDGKPVYVKLSEFGIGESHYAGQVELFIYHGTDEESLRRQLDEAGLITPETESRIDPRLAFGEGG